MLNRLRNSIRSKGEEKGLARKTTEVHVETFAGPDVVERAQRRAPALIMVEGDLPGQVFRLHSGRQIIGRRPECEIRVRERAVSGIHAEVIRDGDNVTIHDLASTNGTLVDGRRIQNPVALAQGNLVKLGNCIFKYVDSQLEVEFTESLHARGTVDPLTGALNRAYLVARLGFIIDTASESRPVSVVAFDYDDFKRINDQYGHAAGDHILRESTTLIMKSFVREQDLFARLGGEEFVLVVPDTPLDRAVDIAERIRIALSERTFLFGALSIQITSSFGVCSTVRPAEQPEALLARADELLYRSKREGRNRVSA